MEVRSFLERVKYISRFISLLDPCANLYSNCLRKILLISGPRVTLSIRSRLDLMNTPVLVLPSQGPPFGMRNQYVNSMAQFETSGFRD